MSGSVASALALVILFLMAIMATVQGQHLLQSIHAPDSFIDKIKLSRNSLVMVARTSRRDSSSFYIYERLTPTANFTLGQTVITTPEDSYEEFGYEVTDYGELFIAVNKIKGEPPHISRTPLFLYYLKSSSSGIWEQKSIIPIKIGTSKVVYWKFSFNGEWLAVTQAGGDYSTNPCYISVYHRSGPEITLKQEMSNLGNCSTPFHVQVSDKYLILADSSFHSSSYSGVVHGYERSDVSQAFKPKDQLYVYSSTILYGQNVGLDGETLAVSWSSRISDGRSGVDIYQRSFGSWSQKERLIATDYGFAFMRDEVALQSNNLLVQASRDSRENEPVVPLFQKSSFAWKNTETIAGNGKGVSAREFALSVHGGVMVVSLYARDENDMINVYSLPSV